MRNLISLFRSALFSTVILVASLGSTPHVNADDTLFVQQVQSIQASRQLTIGQSIDGSSLDRVNARHLDTLLPPLAGTPDNRSLQVQVGTRNQAAVAAVGGPNSTLQIQIGSRLESSIGIRGSRNRVAVDQRGSRLESDIDIKGNNKAVLHIQRGRTGTPEHQPITLHGSAREAMIVLDTPRGRLTRTVNP